jgi:macrolide-specific efflux system membrane fusion protein
MIFFAAGAMEISGAKSNMTRPLQSSFVRALAKHASPARKSAAASLLVLSGLMSVGLGTEPIEVESVLLAPIQEVEVPAQEAGLLQQMTVAEGAMVKEGDLLAQIDDTDAKLEKTRAEIELDNARRNASNDIKVRVAVKASEVAAAELQRGLESQKRYPKSVSETEIDRLRLTADHAKLQVEAAKYDFETAQLALRVQENQVQRAARQVERRRILAPVSGRVVQLFREQGEWIELGQPIARVLRVDRLKAVGSLDARRLDGDPTGRSVRLKVESPQPGQAEFRGRVTFVHSEVNPVNGQLDFWAEIENPDLQLRPGLRASLTISDKPAGTD